MMEEINPVNNIESDLHEVPPCAVNTKSVAANAPDYYMENGYVVFTEAYHLKRGHCCRSGCRHCPYGFKHKR